MSFKCMYYLAIFFLIASCKKSSFLDKKPNDQLVVPTTLTDLQALLDNSDVMNGGNPINGGVDPHLLLSGTDELYVTETRLAGLSPQSLQLYIWDDNFYVGSERFADWDIPYRVVYYSNVVLEGLDKLSVSSTQTMAFNNAKGSALFYRAKSFYQLAQVYSPQYDQSTANIDLGLVLRYSADINEKLARASVAATYQQIIKDLTEAGNLLPDKPSLKLRPSKWAVYALLARVYLTMGDYQKAIEFSTKCLSIDDSLIDFSTVNPTSASAAPFSAYNPEVIFHAVSVEQNDVVIRLAFADSNLVRLYTSDDLRRTLFFRARPNNEFSFRGAYLGTTLPYFTGLATDEVYLIRAECHARIGNTMLAMKDLNDLLVTRWRKNAGVTTYVNQVAATSQEALSIILLERRKELIGRGLRWTDLRRLNKLGSNITVKRRVAGVDYLLLPNDIRYTYLIPPEVIAFNPAIIQNKR